MKGFWGMFKFFNGYIKDWNNRTFLGKVIKLISHLVAIGCGFCMAFISITKGLVMFVSYYIAEISITVMFNDKFYKEIS